MSGRRADLPILGKTWTRMPYHTPLSDKPAIGRIHTTSLCPDYPPLQRTGMDRSSDNRFIGSVHHLYFPISLNDGKFVIITKITFMDSILLIKKIYLEGFKNLGHSVIKNFFKGYAWACFILSAIVVYAFIYRLSTGFAFD